MSDELETEEKKELDPQIMKDTKELVEYMDNIKTKKIDFNKRRSTFLVGRSWRPQRQIETLAKPKTTRYDATICEFISLFLKNEYKDGENACKVSLGLKNKKKYKKKDIVNLAKCLEKTRQKIKRRREELMETVSEKAPCYKKERTYKLFDEKKTAALAIPKRDYLVQFTLELSKLIAKEKIKEEVENFPDQSRLDTAIKKILQGIEDLTTTQKLFMPNNKKLEDTLKAYLRTKSLTTEKISKMVQECKTFMDNTYRLDLEFSEMFNATLNDVIQIVTKHSKAIELSERKDNLDKVMEELTKNKKKTTVHKGKCLAVPEKVDIMKFYRKKRKGKKEKRTRQYVTNYIKKLSDPKKHYLKDVFELYGKKIETELKKRQNKLIAEKRKEKDLNKQKKIDTRNLNLQHHLEKVKSNLILVKQLKSEANINTLKSDIDKLKKKINENERKEKLRKKREGTSYKEFDGINARKEKNAADLKKLEEDLKKAETTKKELAEELEKLNKQLKTKDAFKAPTKKVTFKEPEKKKITPLTKEEMLKKYPQTEQLYLLKWNILKHVANKFGKEMIKGIDNQIKTAKLKITRLSFENEQVKEKSKAIEAIEESKRTLRNKSQLTMNDEILKGNSKSILSQSNKIKRLQLRKKNILMLMMKQKCEDCIYRIDNRLIQLKKEQVQLKKKIRLSSRKLPFVQLCLDMLEKRIKNMEEKKTYWKTRCQDISKPYPKPEKPKILSAEEFKTTYPKTGKLLEHNKMERILMNNMTGKQGVARVKVIKHKLALAKKKDELIKKTLKNAKEGSLTHDEMNRQIVRLQTAIVKCNKNLDTAIEDRKTREMKKTKDDKDAANKLAQELINKQRKLLNMKPKTIVVTDLKSLSDEEKEKLAATTKIRAYPKYYVLKRIEMDYQKRLQELKKNPMIKKDIDPTSANSKKVSDMEKRIQYLQKLFELFLESEKDRLKDKYKEEQYKKIDEFDKRRKCAINFGKYKMEWRKSEPEKIEKLSKPKICKLEGLYNDFKGLMSEAKRERISSELKERKMMKPEYFEELNKKQLKLKIEAEKKRIKQQENLKNAYAKVKKYICSKLFEEIYAKLLRKVPPLVMKEESPMVVSDKFKKIQNATYTFLLCLNGCPVDNGENTIYMNFAAVLTKYIIKTLHSVMNFETLYESIQKTTEIAEKISKTN